MRVGRLTRLLALAAAGLLLAGCGEGASELHQSTEIREAVFPLSGSARVEIATSAGRVTVRGQAGPNEVRATITVHNRASSLAEAERRVDGMVIWLEQDGNRVVLRHDASEQPDAARDEASVDFDVTMPLKADLTVDVGSGAIDVENLEGTIVLKTGDGGIAARGVSGTLDARAGNGSIDVTRSRGALSLDSDNGAIRMTEIEGSIDAETSKGGVAFSGRLVGASHRMSTNDGDLDVELPTDLAIAIDATASHGIDAGDLPLVGDTEGRQWSATLNPPAVATLELLTSAGRIRMKPLP